MTEAEWLACRDPLKMLDFLEHPGFAGVSLAARVGKLVRKPPAPPRPSVEQRLYRAVCGMKRVWFAALGVREPHWGLALEERFAGGEITLAKLLADPGDRGEYWPHPWRLARLAARADAESLDRPSLRPRHADILRCVFGNPFSPDPQPNPQWLTSTVQALARGIVAEQAFDRMPILADALQDAGCDDEHVLTHCREGTAHCRWCWVVDLLLEK